VRHKPDRPQDESPEKSVLVTLTDCEQANHRRDMGKCNVNDHWPVKVAFLVVACHCPEGFGDSEHLFVYEVTTL
jgi:hypothetical protein